MFILLTGAAHEGKTTACWKAISGIRTAGGKVAGFVSPPLLSADGDKVGIEMLDLATGKRQIFARVVEPGQPATVGVYRISEDAIEWAQKVLAAALLSGADWIVVDEIGPLELHQGGGFAFALQPLADSGAHPQRDRGRARIVGGRARRADGTHRCRPRPGDGEESQHDPRSPGQARAFDTPVSR